MANTMPVAAGGIWSRAAQLPGIEEERTRSQLAEMLKVKQEEQLKQEMISTRMAESKAKEEDLLRTMVERRLAGWAPAPGFDVGEFGVEGQPTRWVGVAPGTGGAVGIEEFPQWERRPTDDELKEQMVRARVFGSKGPVELPREKAKREEARDIRVTERAYGLAEKSQVAAEERLEKRLGREKEKEVEAQPRKLELQYQAGKTALVRDSKNRMAEIRKWYANAVTEATTHPVYSANPARLAGVLQETKALYEQVQQDTMADLNTQITRLDEEYGKTARPTRGQPSAVPEWVTRYAKENDIPVELLLQWIKEAPGGTTK